MSPSKGTSLHLFSSPELVARSKVALLNLSSFALIVLLSGTWLSGLVLGLYGVLTYAAAQLIARSEERAVRAGIYYGSLIAHVCGFFFLQQTGRMGILNGENALAPSTLPYLLGFAFYILQGLTLLGAVYRRLMPPLDLQRHLLALSFFGSFLAGPLFNQGQLKKLALLDVQLPGLVRIYENLHFLVGGLLFKFVFAHWLARFVRLDEMASPLLIARSVAAFELQVYFDFAGYSLIAYFLCRSFGLPLYFNFRHPFAARDIPEFWRRWHVGLGTWFKENLFQPLRAWTQSGLAGKTLIPILVFLCSAAWHGPTRNFLAWGLFHGLAFVLAVWVLAPLRKKSWGRFLARAHVLIVVFYGRLLFMDSDLARLKVKIRRLGMFREMGQEFLAALPRSGAELMAFASANGSDIIIAAAIGALILYEIFWVDPEQEGAYAYFRPGVSTLLIFALVLLFFQPLDRAGFVYGR